MRALRRIAASVDRRIAHEPRPCSHALSAARSALILGLITVSACDDAAAPEPLVPFVDALYALVAIDGHALPAAFEYQGSTYLVNAGTLKFVDDTTVTWMLEDLEPVPPETVPIASISGASPYRQPARDSLEVGGADLGPFTVSPWAYGRRTGETLDLRTVDPVPSDPRVPDLAYSPLGLHLWRFERRH